MENKTKYDWSQAPEWAMWIATDDDGHCYGFEFRPKDYSRCWLVDEGACELLHRCASYYPDWRESLEQRPAQEEPEVDGAFNPDGALRIIHKNGQPYGIRDNSGYILFFPKVNKYSGQEQRYIDEIQRVHLLASAIIKALSR